MKESTLKCNQIYVQPTKKQTFSGQKIILVAGYWLTSLLNAVGNVSDCRCRGRELNPGPVPYLKEIDHEIISMAIHGFSFVVRLLIFFRIKILKINKKILSRITSECQRV